MQQQQPQQAQPPYSYADAGYNPFFERDPRTYCANPRVEAQSSLFIQSVVDNAIIYDPFDTTSAADNSASLATTSADQISGGVMQSNDGALQIDLNNSQILYNDGINTLLSLGTSSATGQPNSLTINANDGTPLVQSQA